MPVAGLLCSLGCIWDGLLGGGVSPVQQIFFFYSYMKRWLLAKPVCASLFKGGWKQLYYMT